MVCTTVSVVGLITEIEAEFLLVTQMRPSGAIATLRGEVPTVISATRALVDVSITLTESLSGLMTHTLAGFPVRLSNAIAVELVGLFAVLAVATA